MTDASEVNFGSETARAAVAKFLMAASGFVGTVIFANLLNPSQFGGYYLLFALVKIADRPILGLTSASKKRFSETGTNPGELLSVQLFSGGIWIFITSIIAWIFTGSLREYTGLTVVVPLFILLLAAESSYDSLALLVQATGRISAATWVDAVRSYITLPLQVGLIILGYGAAGMALGLIGATVLTCPLLLYILNISPNCPTPTITLSPNAATDTRLTTSGRSTPLIAEPSGDV